MSRKSKSAKKHAGSAKPFMFAAAAAAVGLLAREQVASAGNFTWNIADPAGTWGLSTNWSMGAAPLSADTNDNLTFNVGNGTYVNSSTITSGNLLTSVGSISLTAAAGATTFSAFNTNSALTIIGNGISNTSTNSVTFNELLAVGNNDSGAVFNSGTKAFTVANTNSFVIGSGSNLSFTGGGAISFASSAMTLGAGSTLTNSTSGVIATTLGASSSVLSLAGGNTVSVGSGLLSLPGGLIDAGSGSTILVTGGELLEGTTTNTASPMSLNTGDILSISGGSVSLAGNGGRLLTGTGTTSQILITGTGTLDANANVAQVTLGNGSILSLGGSGTLSLGTGTGMIAGSGSTIDVSGSSSLLVTNAGGGFYMESGSDLSIFGGTVSITKLIFSAGTSLSNASNNTIFVSGGNVTLSSAGKFAGASTGVGQNTTVSVSGGNVFLPGLEASNSTIAVSGGTLSLGTAGGLTGTTALIIGGGSTASNVTLVAMSPEGTGLYGGAVSTSSQIISIGSGVITIVNPNSGSTSNLNITDFSPIVTVSNSFTVSNTATGSPIFQFGQGIAASSSTTSTITFNANGNTASQLLFSGSTNSLNFQGSYSLLGGGIVSLATALPSFASGTTLSGSGTWTQTSSLVMASGSSLNPGGFNGASAGVLNISNNLSVAPGSHLVFSLNGASSNSDMVAVSTLSQLAFGGTPGTSSVVNLALANVTLPALHSSATYEIFSYGTYAGDTSSTITSDFNITLNGSSSGMYSSSEMVAVTDPTNGASDGQIDVVVTGVPEPASLSLLGLGAVGLLGRRRKRRRTEAAS